MNEERWDINENKNDDYVYQVFVSHDHDEDYDDSYPTKHWKDNIPQNKSYAEHKTRFKRKRGERFAARGPPSCRALRNPGGCSG